MHLPGRRRPAPRLPGQTPAAAPEPAAPKPVTLTTGLDFTSAYFFRGIRQHSGGAIAQPYVDFGIAARSGV